MKKILVVDDEPHMSRVLKLYLERAGYAVQTCPNGQVALAAVLQSAPDAMLTDIQMPVMTGRELCQALQEQLPDRTFPIFVMTSMTNDEHRDWTGKISNLEFLEKPLSMRAVVAQLDKTFGTPAGTAEVSNV